MSIPGGPGLAGAIAPRYPAARARRRNGKNMDTVEITAGPEATHVVLGATMEISMAQALYRKLTPRLEQSHALVMDASQVQRIDTAALQTLAYFCRCAHERGIPFRWHAISPALQQAAQTLGLSSFLFRNA